MNLVADEGVDAPIVRLLRENGIAVYYIAEENPSIKDSQVIQIAVDQHAVLITQDKDFGELVYRLKQTHKGVILLRLTGLTPTQKADTTLSIIFRFGDELIDAFAVVTEQAVKIRK